MKWTIVGAGAIGGVVGAELHRIGEDVALVARGEHGAAIRRDGLTFVDPAGRRALPIPAVGSVAELELHDGDVVVLAVKAQHTAGLLEQLAVVAPPGVRIVCAQNGVDNERQAARFFGEVIGASVTLLATHLEPGVVMAHSDPVLGTLQLGRYPAGTDGVAEVADVLGRTRIRVDVLPDVMAFKNAKLRVNLANALEVICTEAGDRAPLVERLLAEASAAFEAAGMPVPGPGVATPVPEPVDAATPRTGGSTRQSVQRAAGSVETDYLNGEIVLLGRLHGIPTPANELLQQLARQVIAGRLAAESVPPEELLARLSADRSL